MIMVFIYTPLVTTNCNLTSKNRVIGRKLFDLFDPIPLDSIYGLINPKTLEIVFMV